MLSRTVLWWGRSDVEYSRNRIVRQLLCSLGWEIIDFNPKLSLIADIEAYIYNWPHIDLVWVPCFRQRDVVAARRWAKRKKIPLIFDPLISAYDKQIWERNKFSEHSRKAVKLLKWEQSLFQAADYVIADTEQHAQFYNKVLLVDRDKLAVLPVGAEEGLFKPQDKALASPIEILFYGSYIALQGPEVIAQAVKLYKGPEVHWRFIGEGPLRAKVEQRLNGYNNVEFINWLPYEQLPNYIANADICLGIFGGTEKTSRVIPNKVYQALACGRPVITCYSEAYPLAVRQSSNTGLFFVPEYDAEAIVNKVHDLVLNSEYLFEQRQKAWQTYQHYFSNQVLVNELKGVLSKVLENKIDLQNRG